VPDEVLTRLKSLPVLLLKSGVATTLAYYAARSTDSDLGRAYRVVRAALIVELVDELRWDPAPAADGLYARLAAEPVADLSRAFARLEAFADWFRKLAEGMQRDQERGAGKPPKPAAGEATGDGTDA